jgi:hypothetical protein
MIPLFATMPTFKAWKEAKKIINSQRMTIVEKLA